MQSEIKNFNDINQKEKFLNNTPCGIMFEEIYKKVEVQMYLNKITKNAIEKLENNYSKLKLDYNLNKITDELNNTLSNEIDDDKIRQENFNQKYIQNLDESLLKKLLEENKNNKNIYDYLNSKLSILNKKREKYSNKNFLSFCYGYKNSDKLINLYINKFYIAIDFIEQIFKDILNEIKTIPISIKKLCRIISELINQKFPNINTIDKNNFITKFFFDKLLIPFLTNRNIFLSISENTSYNLKIICQILKKYIDGDLFCSEDSEFNFTPFNLYIINNIENVFNLIQNLIKVELSPYIEIFINNKLTQDLEYDYFKENPNKNVSIKSILYNFIQIKALVTTMANNKQILFNDNKNFKIEKVFQKMMYNKNLQLLDKIINEEKEDYNKYIQSKNNKKEKKKEEELSIPKIKYFLITEIYLNEKY